MKVRRIFDEKEGTTRGRHIVWFGSYGTYADGTAKFVNPDNKHDNFASYNEMVRDTLIQQLSVIKHELWYNWQFGMPLVDDNTSKIQIDAFVMQTITTHQDVFAITSFKSAVVGHNYTCTVEFTTRFGNIELTL